MSIETATDFLLLTLNQSAIKDISAITDPNELVELANSNGYEFTIENILEAMRELDNKLYRGKQQKATMAQFIGRNLKMAQRRKKDGFYKDLEKSGVPIEQQLIIFNCLSEEIKNWAKV